MDVVNDDLKDILELTFQQYVAINQPFFMRRALFKTLAKINKTILPSYSKRQLDLAEASKIQMAIIGWRWYVTKNALN